MTTQSDELLADLFTTALEGGIGYWSSCSAYYWGDDGVQDVLGFYADLIDDADDSEPCYTVDRAVMLRGYDLAISAEWVGKLGWSTDAPPSLSDSDGIENWDYDAGDADMILQLGLFGDVVYG